LGPRNPRNPSNIAAGASSETFGFFGFGFTKVVAALVASTAFGFDFAVDFNVFPDAAVFDSGIAVDLFALEPSLPVALGVLVLLLGACLRVLLVPAAFAFGVTSLGSGLSESFLFLFEKSLNILSQKEIKNRENEHMKDKIRQIRERTGCLLMMKRFSALTR